MKTNVQFHVTNADIQSELMSMIYVDIYCMIYKSMKNFDLYLNIKFFDLFR